MNGGRDMPDGSTSPGPRRMLFQFSLYGFLKNQRYFEPFLLLFFLAAFGEGDAYAITKYGLLLGYRDVLQNFFEVPSGAIADLYGRRRCMMFSFGAYIVSFAVFGLASAMWQFALAMTFFALGEAFRTGTHKAMIFDYLAHEGRTGEKTRYYGTTRSWSKMGSALAAVIAPALVFLAAVPQRRAGADGGDGLGVYRYIFLGCIVPYLIALVNFALYPKYLDGSHGGKPSVAKLFSHLLGNLRDAVRVGSLRRLVVESMGYEGLYKAAKDYLQPIVKYTAVLAAAGIPLLAGLELADAQETAILIGVVYFFIGLLESFASRRSDAVRRKFGGEERGTRFLWWVNLGVFAGIAVGLLVDWRLGGPISYLGLTVAIVGFMALAVLQNLWRPMHIGRFDTHTDAKSGATVLSIEAQAKSLSAAVFYPVLGLAVDAFTRWGGIRCDAGHEPPVRFLPVAAAGVLFAVLVLAARRGPAKASPAGGGDAAGV